MNIKWSKRGIEIDGKRIYFISGEIEYFRIPKETWSDRLNKLKEANANTVAFYIPWEWHESVEGKYDFTGKTHPQRDLKDWLELCEKSGLYIYPRIGPYIYSEWKLGGIPEWLGKNYPEALCKKLNFEKEGALAAVSPGTISYLNKVYLRHVERWYKNLINLFKKHLNRIIFIQPDNEIGGAVPFDYQEHVLNIYRKWLKDKYKDIDILNRVHRTGYKDFDSIMPPTSNPKDYQELTRWLDWDRYRYKHYSLYAEKLTSILRENGVNTPLIYNCPMEPTYHYEYGSLSKEGIVGIDHYPIGEGGRGVEPIFNYSVLPKLLFNLEVTREIIGDAPLILPECEVGLWSDTPRLYPADLSLFYYTCAAHGATGFSFYQFAGGENPLDFGGITKSYNYQAPVSFKGELMPHYETLKEFGRFLNSDSDLMLSDKDYDAGFGFYLPYHAFYPCYPEEFDFGDTARIGLKVNMKKILEPLYYKGLLKSLIISGVNLEFVDLEKADLKRLIKYPQLWVFSLDFMAKNVQEKLVEYVRRGGILNLNPIVPYLDENMNDCRILEKTLGIVKRVSRVPTIDIGEDKQDILGIEQLPISHILEEYEVSKDVFILGKIHRTGKPSSLERKSGKGRIRIIGGGINYILKEYEVLVKEILRRDVIKLKVRSSNPEILAYRRSSKEWVYIFVFNYHGMDMNTEITTEINGKEIRLGSYLPQRSHQIFKLDFRGVEELKDK